MVQNTGQTTVYLVLVLHWNVHASLWVSILLILDKKCNDAGLNNFFLFCLFLFLCLVAFLLIEVSLALL